MAERHGWGHRLGTAVLVAGAVAVGGAVNAYAPGPELRERPFINSGHKGDRVVGRTFDAELLGVRGGAIVTSRSQPHDTGGVWVIIKVRLTAHEKPQQINYGAIRDGDDRIFRSSGRIDNNPPYRIMQPGIPIECEIVFEVPKDVPLPIAARLSASFSDLRMDSVAQLELDVTRQQLQQWAADQAPITVERAQLADAGGQ